MGKLMEAIFCVAYLIVTFILGISIIKKAKDNKESKLFGIMGRCQSYDRNAHAAKDLHVCVDGGNGI